MHLGYDKYIFYFSGGKDSIAQVLYLLECGVDREKMELWHHEIDGREGSSLMDWTCTPAYCKAFANALGIPIYYSWREGGFEQEMLREDSLTGGVYFEDPDIGLKYLPSSDQDRYKNTRLKFPQPSMSLSVRWCSAYLKIDVARRVLSNSKRLISLKTLVVSGERAEESDKSFLEKSESERIGRGSYAKLEIDGSDLRKGKKVKRWISRARPIRDWTEKQVWEIIERWNIRLHPAYYLGYGRVSCFDCIFGDKNQFATGHYIYPDKSWKIISYEGQFDFTLKNGINLIDLILSGEVYPATLKENEHLQDARSSEYNHNIIMRPGEWYLPSGAFKRGSCGAI